MSKNYKVLNNINFPSDIKKLSHTELKVLANEVREEMSVFNNQPAGDLS